MTVPAQPKRWVSLGLLFGGHTPSYKAPPAGSAPRRTPAPVSADEHETELMRAAGYEPEVPLPRSPFDTLAKQVRRLRGIPQTLASRCRARRAMQAHPA